MSTLPLMLVEQGRISLDDKVSRWFPHPLAADQVTVRMLVANTADYIDHVTVDDFVKVQLAEPFRTFTDAELINYSVRDGRMTFPPVTSQQYSHTDNVVLGQVIQRATGQSMKDLYEKNIFGPLGIKNTQFPVDQDIQSLVLHAFTMDRRFLHRRTVGPVPLPAPGDERLGVSPEMLKVPFLAVALLTCNSMAYKEHLRAGWATHIPISLETLMTNTSGLGAETSATTSSSSVATDQADKLIASNKVEGTAVYNRKGERLGTVENFMVGRRSGQVAYAVLSFGGFLGVGEGHHPLPWNALTYDTSLGGYVVDLDKDQLSEAPTHQAGEDPFSDPAYERRIREYWESIGSTL